MKALDHLMHTAREYGDGAEIDPHNATLLSKSHFDDCSFQNFTNCWDWRCLSIHSPTGNSERRHFVIPGAMSQTCVLEDSDSEYDQMITMSPILLNIAESKSRDMVNPRVCTFTHKCADISKFSQFCLMTPQILSGRRHNTGPIGSPVRAPQHARRSSGGCRVVTHPRPCHPSRRTASPHAPYLPHLWGTEQPPGLHANISQRASGRPAGCGDHYGASANGKECTWRQAAPRKGTEDGGGEL